MKLPELNQSLIIKSVIVLVVVVVLYFLVRKAVRTAKSDKYANDLKNEIIPDKLTYSLNQYEVFAERLHAVLYPLNTDEDVIYSIFNKMRTLSDVLQLVKAYGIRSIALKFDDFSLVSAFQERLTESEIQKVNTILKSKNINFSF